MPLLSRVLLCGTTPALGPFTFALLALLVAPPAGASVSFSVSPIRVDLSVAPGETKTDAVMIENRGNEPLRLRVTIADWHLAPDGTPVFVKRGGSPADSMSEWIEVNPTELDVPPLARMPVRYTVSAPEGTSAGGYHGAILIESVPEMVAHDQPTRAYLNARIGVILYDRIGTVAPEIEISAQDVVRAVDTPGGMALRVTVRNIGHVHARFTGSGRVVDGEGREVEVVPISDAVVLPTSDRQVVVRLTEPLPRGDFTVVTRLDVGLPELLEAETRVAAPFAP